MNVVITIPATHGNLATLHLANLICLAKLAAEGKCDAATLGKAILAMDGHRDKTPEEFQRSLRETFSAATVEVCDEPAARPQPRNRGPK